MTQSTIGLVERLRNGPPCQADAYWLIDTALAEALCDEAAVLLSTQETTIAELVAALEGVMIGGNHLALLIGADHPPYIAEPLDALEHYGAGDTYEIWCCWRSIMQARETLTKSRSAL